MKGDSGHRKLNQELGISHSIGQAGGFHGVAQFVAGKNNRNQIVWGVR
jgi:hypothetical protein